MGRWGCSSWVTCRAANTGYFLSVPTLFRRDKSIPPIGEGTAKSDVISLLINLWSDPA
jgi:hypothetical protein